MKKKEKEILREKKLKQMEIEDKLVSKIISEIIKLEKRFSQRLVKRACYRYNQAILEKNNAEKEIRVLENKLNQAKAKLK